MKIVYYACVFLACTLYTLAQSGHTHSEATHTHDTHSEGQCNHDHDEYNDHEDHPAVSFLPEWSVIMDMSYLNRNVSQNLFSHFEIPGFTHGHTDDSHADHAHSASEEGFNLNYAEVGLRAPLASYGELFTVFHLSESSFEIEEAFIKSNPFFSGFQVKLGKFYSGFGRINSQHAHAWNFTDKPLVNKVFFGVHGLLEKGIQLTWESSSDIPFLIGVESLQGDNEMSFGTGGFETDFLTLDDVSSPSVTTMFFKSGFHSGTLDVHWGMSYATGDTRLNHMTEDAVHEHDEFHEEEGGHVFAGESDVFGADLSARFSLDSGQYLELNGEYIARDMDGIIYEEHGTDSLRKKQAGWYGELIYSFNHLWRAGLRLDTLSRNDIIEQGIDSDFPDSLKKTTVMLEWTPREMSRLRLQYSRNEAVFLEGLQQKVNEFTVQYTVIIGHHHH